MRIATLSHGFFAATMIGLGVLGLAQGEFTPAWTGVPASFPARETLVYLSALISLIVGIGLVWRRTAAIASGLLLGSILIWALLFKGPPVFRAPTATGVWWALGESAVMAGAGWVLYMWFVGDRGRQDRGFGTGHQGLRIARALFGLGLIPFGIAHFTYLDRTISMVPAWLPWHLAWAAFFGASFIAAGVAVLIGVYARLAATLVTVQLGLFTLLVWVPIMAATPTASDWTEFVSSWLLTAAAWVVADSWRSSTNVERHAAID